MRQPHVRARVRKDTGEESNTKEPKQVTMETGHDQHALCSAQDVAGCSTQLLLA